MAAATEQVAPPMMQSPRPAAGLKSPKGLLACAVAITIVTLASSASQRAPDAALGLRSAVSQVEVEKVLAELAVADDDYGGEGDEEGGADGGEDDADEDAAPHARPLPTPQPLRGLTAGARRVMRSLIRSATGDDGGGGDGVRTDAQGQWHPPWRQAPYARAPGTAEQSPSGIGLVHGRPDLAPRAIIMHGCSGSTFALRTLRMLVGNTTAVKVAGGAFELLRPKFNKYYSATHSTTRAFRESYAHAAELGHTLIFKADTFELTTSMAKTFHRLGVRSVFAWRANALDEMVCQILDCFDLAKEKHLGHAVFANGSKSRLCFERRRREERGLSTPVMAHVNTEHLATRLERKLRASGAAERSRFVHKGIHVHKHVVTYEDMAAHTYSVSNLGRSALAFAEVLAGWGLRVPLHLIERELMPYAGKRHPPSSHREKIHNYEDVARALRRGSRAVRALLRP